MALGCQGQTLTYASLDAAAGQIAAGPTRHGIRPGERVTLFSENRWEWVAAYHGILRAGCVVNPVNATLTAPELAAIVGWRLLPAGRGPFWRASARRR
ncbi:AMP-binding protein [Streptomyces sp. NPDC059460]|uniref:AMP-binding protein n=1 Tax=Streptomyces sp. NPDC059460 TaxID=3346840 RepID=UPI0036C8DB6F